MDVFVADEFREHGRGVADARADDEDVVAVVDVEGVEQSGDSRRREHARPLVLLGAVVVGSFGDELVARHRPHRHADGFADAADGVFEAVDHVVP